jgi:cyclophilin family peptidyl-prolyl cis-trans isomerase
MKSAARRKRDAEPSTRDASVSQKPVLYASSLMRQRGLDEAFEGLIQGGDPTATGRGGPGYKFEDEVKTNPHKHQVGSLSMANSGPNTNGSQFFITHIATDWLNGKHTVFGQVRTGQETVNAIKQGDELISVMITEE